LGLLFALSLLPWLWAWLGLCVIQDYRLTMGLYELLGCLIPFFLCHKLPPRFRRVDLSMIVTILVLIGFTLTSMMMLASFFGPQLIELETFKAALERVKLNPKTDFVLLSLYFISMNPLIEECFWRGLILDGFQQHYSPSKALFISSFFFGAWHYMVISQFFTPLWSVLTTVMVMFGGGIFGLLYQNSRSLWPSILVHGLGGDLAIVLITEQLYVSCGLMESVLTHSI
jgi:membrane protease YdiL (CAAX protease family)